MTKSIFYILQILIFSLLTMFVSITQAQYVSESDKRKQDEATKKVKFAAALEAVIGKTFWYRPNPKASHKIEFLEPELLLPGDNGTPYRFRYKFFVTMETSFIVVGYEKSLQNLLYLKLQFPDGKVGYLNVNSYADSDPDNYPVIEHLYSENKRTYDFQEYIFSGPPQEIFAKKQAKLNKEAAESNARQAKAAESYAREAKAREARGGVSIGMTTAQVLNSSWGRPNNINRTISANGTREQWVYGVNNYLYFDNGILTTIQH